MQKRLLFLLSLSCLALSSSSCQTNQAGSLLQQAPTDAIQVNQASYHKEGPKYAVIIGANRTPFFLITEAGDTVFRGVTGAEMLWDASAQWAAEADFSDYNGALPARISVEGIGTTSLLHFSEQPSRDILLTMVKALYYQRCSQALPSQYALEWARPMGHADGEVMIHSSAATQSRPAQSTHAFPGGWYDAGDYGKYSAPTAFVAWSLLHLSERNNSLDESSLSIPESDNSIPDLIDESLVGIRYLLSIQDQNGSVPHKLTALHHAPLVMPEEDQDQRYLIGQDASASLTFSACMALAYRVLAQYETELPGLADSCLAASRLAWNWAMDHQDVHFRNPSGVSTGEYKDDFIEDEMAWAMLELWLSTGEEQYVQPTALLEVVQSRNPFHGDASWKAMLSLTVHRDRLSPQMRRQWTEQLLWRSNRMKEHARFNPYHVPLGFNEYDFNWGSNAIHSREGLWYLMTAVWSGDSDWIDEATRVSHYLLGMNPLDLSFVTGIGDRYPTDPHHRPSKADGVPAPVPGFMVGGPQTVVKQQDCPEYPSELKALHYLDDWCSYTTNEVAINYNACGWLLFGWIDYAQENRR